MKGTEEKIWASEAAKRLGFFYYADSRGESLYRKRGLPGFRLAMNQFGTKFQQKDEYWRGHQFYKTLAKLPYKVTVAELDAAIRQALAQIKTS